MWVAWSTFGTSPPQPPKDQRHTDYRLESVDLRSNISFGTLHGGRFSETIFDTFADPKVRDLDPPLIWWTGFQ
jgi:hypothetical protein